MLDNIIEKNGLDAVSEKTRISKKNLEKLQKKEFSDFSKPRALGFISILEREYKEDLSELKEDIIKWFENESDKQTTHIAFPPAKDGKSIHWIVIIPLIMVLVFGFYLYQNEFSNTQVAIEKSLSIKSIEKIYKEQNNQKTESSKAIKEPEQKQAEENSSNRILDEKREDTLTVDKNISTSIESAEKDVKPVNSIKKKSDANTSISPYVPIENIIVYPNRKMWIGVINLKNRKRKSRVISQTFSIEADSEKLIITGHGFFSINDTVGNNLKFSDPDKHYFVLKDGVLKEIDSKEFMHLNGGKIW
ncbi:hypothetical protein RZR97_11410 [Hydrogenimonas thermophila]|uniref:hypothetical protein n=1 Tax=Hydrogenimonas thermophila TaxID=223786 RepID=UPI002937043D|nr:hypothetical protein [Hydrogenimonas thermophila]WOE69703.1 hypothetical protein RZR91_11420 [Hydrogenimonas thermophila]WOE72217.1 hypothetical protein RZR97_11410 [Hydrogenimonas thermophila]